MSNVTTTGRWIRLPTALGGSDLARKDQPGSAALFQALASNATLACRENELRVIFERGPIQVWADCETSDVESTLRWSALESDGVLAQYAGSARVRLWGEGQEPPRVVLAARGAVSDVMYSLGVALIAQPTFGPPNVVATSVARTQSATAADLTVTMTLTPEMIGRVAVAPHGAVTDPTTLDEVGDLPLVHFFVGAWCTSDDGGQKASLSALTLYLKEPA